MPPHRNLPAHICCLSFCPVSAFQEDMSHCLASTSTLASVALSFIDGEQIATKANIAGAHSRDDRADGSIFVAVDVRLSWVLKVILTRISLQHICSYSLRAYIQVRLQTIFQSRSRTCRISQYSAVLFGTATSYLGLEIGARGEVRNDRHVGSVGRRRWRQVPARTVYGSPLKTICQVDFALA